MAGFFVLGVSQLVAIESGRGKGKRRAIRGCPDYVRTNIAVVERIEIEDIHDEVTTMLRVDIEGDDAHSERFGNLADAPGTGEEFEHLHYAERSNNTRFIASTRLNAEISRTVSFSSISVFCLLRRTDTNFARTFSGLLILEVGIWEDYLFWSHAVYLTSLWKSG